MQTATGILWKTATAVSGRPPWGRTPTAVWAAPTGLPAAETVERNLQLLQVWRSRIFWEGLSNCDGTDEGLQLHLLPLRRESPLVKRVQCCPSVYAEAGESLTNGRSRNGEESSACHCGGRVCGAVGAGECRRRSVYFTSGNGGDMSEWRRFTRGRRATLNWALDEEGNHYAMAITGKMACRTRPEV